MMSIKLLKVKLEALALELCFEQRMLFQAWIIANKFAGAIFGFGNEFSVSERGNAQIFEPAGLFSPV